MNLGICCTSLLHKHEQWLPTQGSCSSKQRASVETEKDTQEQAETNYNVPFLSWERQETMTENTVSRISCVAEVSREVQERS